MSKLFYDHLVLIDELFVEIESLEVSDTEKQTMKEMIDDIMHHKVLTRILDLLPKEDHEKFLEQFHKTPYDNAHLKFVEDRTDRDIGAEIIIIAQETKRELKKEIQKHKKKKNKKD